MELDKLLNNRVKELGLILEQLPADLVDNFYQCAKIMTSALKNKKTIYWCGNGGSAAESSHLATELTKLPFFASIGALQRFLHSKFI